jgi:hypothetical protein
MSIDSRVCTKCGLDKPLREFSKAPRGKYGVKASCKACDAARHASLDLPSRALPPEALKARRLARRGDSKRCTNCGETKPYEQFSLSRKGVNGGLDVYRSTCKECQAAAARKWFADNPQRARANSRKFNLLKTYGITLDDYNALLRKQHGVCAICGEDEPNEHGRTGKKFRLSVDHCHDSGAIRGLLCQRCNRAIGLLKDDPVLMRRAISYLLRSRKDAAD